MRSVFVVLIAAGCAVDVQPACAPGQLARSQRLPPDPHAGMRIFTHAHNDYEHARPLFDALDAGFTSVEADIWYAGGALEVSHDEDSSKGTLKELYLDPLAARVAANHGSVFGDGVPFRLVIDVKENRTDLVGALTELLEQYPMILAAAGDTASPVVVVLTGNDAVKRAVVDRTPMLGVRDSNQFSWSDPPSDSRWTDYALDWSQFIEWDGVGTMSDEDRTQLACLVATAHAGNRKLRLYGAPDRASVWAVELAAGVDYISSDDLRGLARFLSR